MVVTTISLFFPNLFRNLQSHSETFIHFVQNAQIVQNSLIPFILFALKIIPKSFQIRSGCQFHDVINCMQESQWIEHFPIESLANNAPIEFIISPETEHWTDLSKSYLYVKFKIIKADGNNLDADSNVAPVNNFLSRMFSSVYLYLNNKLISSNSNTYPYRAISKIFCHIMLTANQLI